MTWPNPVPVAEVAASAAARGDAKCAATVIGHHGGQHWRHAMQRGQHCLMSGGSAELQGCAASNKPGSFIPGPASSRLLLEGLHVGHPSAAVVAVAPHHLGC